MKTYIVTWVDGSGFSDIDDTAKTVDEVLKIVDRLMSDSNVTFSTVKIYQAERMHVKVVLSSSN